MHEHAYIVTCLNLPFGPYQSAQIQKGWRFTSNASAVWCYCWWPPTMSSGCSCSLRWLVGWTDGVLVKTNAFHQSIGNTLFSMLKPWFPSVIFRKKLSFHEKSEIILQTGSQEPLCKSYVNSKFCRERSSNYLWIQTQDIFVRVECFNVPDHTSAVSLPSR